jgi:hypothetical protein
MTHFASPERSSKKELDQQIEIICNNPVIDGLMNTVNGFLAVLNENRQILAVNNEFMQMLGIEDPQQVLGLRPGESIHCIHANKEKGGCGTSKYCSTCGAAIAVVSSLSEDVPVKRRCAIEVKKNGKIDDIFLEVQSHPVKFNEQKFILLFLQDITNQQKWAAMEKSFFHDMNNIVGALIGTAELIKTGEHEKDPELIDDLENLSQRFAHELSIQKYLSATEGEQFTPSLSSISLNSLFTQLKTNFKNHPMTHEKKIVFNSFEEDFTFRTDISLILRIMENLIKNALEASGPGDTIKVFVTSESNSLTLNVWNKQSITDKNAKRIFQRNFSTKSELGRGMGLYSVKLFGEKFLNGKVGFESSPEDGTTFHISFSQE